MESKKLEAMLLSTDLGSFTKAAEVLGYTQSGLTHMMNSLEKEVGFPLLERGRSGVTLSPAGQQIAPAIREFLQATARLDHAIEEASKAHQPVIRLSVYNSIATHWLPTILQRFQQSHPEVSVDIRMATHIDDCYQQLEAGRIDAILGSKQPGANCTWYHLYADKMYAIVPKGGRPELLKEFPVEYFNDQSFIMPTQGFDRDILPIFERSGVHPRIQPTAVDDPTVVKMVEHGLGISMMTELVLRGRDDNVLTIPVKPCCYRELGIAIHSEEHISDALRSFLTCTQQTVAELISDT